MRIFTLILTSGLLLLLTNSANAAGFAKVGLYFGAWQGLTTSARLSALGGGDLADSGPSTLLVNPAPLGSGSSAEFSYDYTDYINEVEFHTYAAAVELSNFRLSLVRQDHVADDIPIRTAFNPEGNGETFDIRERMRLTGLSYNFRELIGEGSPFSWSLGLVWRKSTGDYQDFTGEGNSLDIGTTVRWATHYDRGWTSLTGVASRVNATNSKYVIDDLSLFLPRSHRLGLTFETALRKTGETSDRFKFLLAYSRNAQIETDFWRSTDHYGVEITFFELVAARYGHNTFVREDVASWGLGVHLDQHWLGPLTIDLDWGKMSYNHEFISGEKALWGVRAGYDF